MKKHKDSYLNGDDEIDILDFLSKLSRHWKKIVVAGLAGAAAGFVYFSSLVPPPHSELSFEIGFKNINEGKYPDGNAFNKNDVIADNLVENALRKIPEITAGGLWSKASVKGALSVNPIYPMDIQIAKENLSGSAKLKPEEMVANYDKVMKYYPKQYRVSFHPKPEMPRQMQEKFLDTLLGEFRSYVVTNRLPLFLDNNLNVSALIEEKAYSTTYQFFKSTLASITALIDTLSNASVGLASSNLAMLKMGIGNLAKLEGAQSSIKDIERLILDDKALPDMVSYQHSLESDIKRLEGTLSMKQKQSDFKLKMAELPLDAQMAETVNKSVENREAGTGKLLPGTQSVLDVLLTFNKEYYTLMRDADTLFKEQTAIENDLKELKERLARVQAPYRGNRTREERTAELKARLIQTNIAVSELMKEFETNIENAYVKSEPPVTNSFVSHTVDSLSKPKVAALGLFCALLAALAASGTVVAEGRKEKVRSAEQQVSSLHPGPKISSKN